MGHVSCNLSLFNIRRTYESFVPYGACGQLAISNVQCAICGYKPSNRNFIARSLSFCFCVPYGGVSCHNGVEILNNVAKSVSSPMGRVSCNRKQAEINALREVSSPMGRVSCNKPALFDHIDEYGFVPYGACELQPKPSNIVNNHLGFVPYGACELQPLKLNKKGLMFMFRPLWGV